MARALNGNAAPTGGKLAVIAPTRAPSDGQLVAIAPARAPSDGKQARATRRRRDHVGRAVARALSDGRLAVIAPVRALSKGVIALARALIVILLVAYAAPVRADVDPQTIEQYLTRGKKLFDELDYAGAVQTLEPVTRDARATRAQRLRALELIALAEFIRNDRGAARATFERILDIDPGYQLRDTSGSPKIRAFFEDLKRQLIPGYDPNAGADLEHAAPTAGTAGHAIELDVRATRGGERVFELVVATRRRGELAYKIAPASPRGGGRWRARVTPAPSAKPYELEYYIEARDAGGAAVARIASPNVPLEIALTAGGIGGDKRRWYSRWYVIAGGAAILATGITGLTVAATRGPDPGTLPPRSVTVTP